MSTTCRTNLRTHVHRSARLKHHANILAPKPDHPEGAQPEETRFGSHRIMTGTCQEFTLEGIVMTFPDWAASSNPSIIVSRHADKRSANSNTRTSCTPCARNGELGRIKPGFHETRLVGAPPSGASWQVTFRCFHQPLLGNIPEVTCLQRAKGNSEGTFRFDVGVITSHFAHRPAILAL